MGSPVARRPRSGWVRWLLRAVVIGYFGMLVVWPLVLVVQNTFADGLTSVREALSDPQVTFALWLTVQAAFWSVLINTVFGVGISLLLVRYRFAGRRVLSTLIDLPLSVSPVVVGLALVLVYGGVHGWFGPTLEAAGIQVIFAMPGIVLATAFVALPLVIREVVPVLQEIGDEQEQAARSLGATAPQVFRRITVPAIRWAVVYGVVLGLARSLGEFGAVKIVSGNLVQNPQTATLVVEQKYQDFEQSAAYATSFLLAFAVVLCLIVVLLIRRGPRHEYRRPWCAQEVR
ncbi:MAG: sulfate ABC transporter permease subunit [Stackebrandtia sp.]